MTFLTLQHSTDQEGYISVRRECTFHIKGCQWQGWLMYCLYAIAVFEYCDVCVHYSHLWGHNYEDKLYSEIKHSSRNNKHFLTLMEVERAGSGSAVKAPSRGKLM